ncbi:hypothetical protein F0562_010069 [Nyssa sinensis]|uniref:RNase III domain-containing protein n=1 Tax=Nyssa sinensis TaxID=561372 RepID=A0A5J5A0P1_9ASTE|nr:hypothetical protein F0562_010069 [Nyssa sinensis]
MANLPPSLSMNVSFGGPSSSSNAGGAQGNRDRKMQSAEQLVLDLSNPDLRENALLELSKKRELFQDLAPLLWNSFGTIAALLQEIVSIYPVLSPPNLTPAQSNRVCNALALLQCVASHQDTRMSFLNAHIPLYLYPFLNTTSKSRPFEYLRLTSLGVIGALVKVDDTEVISFLLSTEIIPLCLRTMEMGSELSKTVATFIVQKILLDDVGLDYICTTAERFFAVGRVLGNMVVTLAEQPSSRLLKHIIRCYLRLSDNPRACDALRSCLPDMLRDATFSSCLREDPTTRRWLQQLLHNVQGPRVALQAGGGFDHLLSAKGNGMIEDDAYELKSEDYIMDMVTSVRAVEELLTYRFKNKRLLEEALTHSSYTDSASYQRLEFVGDAALGLAISNFVFLAYPDLDPGQLSLIRAANISTEKLARVAVRHGLYRYVRHNAAALDEKVRDFVLAVQQEDYTVVYGGLVKAPKILADIVESVAAAVYVDCEFDLKRLWVIFRGLLEPIVTLDILQQQPQPVTMLFELCQKDGKRVDIKHWRKGEKNIATVYVDGRYVATSSSEQKENAKLHAATAALQKLLPSKENDRMSLDISSAINGTNEIEGAKQKLHELSNKKKLPKPSYRIVKEEGPAHERKFICSVHIETVDGLFYVMGEEKSRVKDAENSAASLMIRGLQESKYI